MRVSKHAHNRVKERAGKKLNPVQLAINAERNGLKHNEMSGNLRKWVDSHVLSSDIKATPYIYNNQLFLVKGGVLVTVIPVPGNLNSLVAKLIQKKKSLQGMTPNAS